MELIGLYLVATGLLVVAGVAKAVRPDDTARALGELVPASARAFAPLPSLRMLVRVGAVSEAALGLVATAFPRPVTAGLVATSYALFGAVVLYVRSRGGSLSTCGCFGRADTPATVMHAVIDLVLVGVSLTVALTSPVSGDVVDVLKHQPAAGIPLVFASAVGLYLAYVVLAVLPALEGVRRIMQPSASSSTTESTP